ncbi:hypothetical protein HanIR_Chr08g0373801 [Helianthus annuus]|nr:hypothetical protein HanIR_Chr08g0373801 [Helianthus annuus]
MNLSRSDTRIDWFDRSITWWLWVEDGGDDTDLPFGGQIYRLKLKVLAVVYKLSTGSVCSLAWPPNFFVVQVLNDFTNKVLM